MLNVSKLSKVESRLFKVVRVHNGLQAHCTSLAYHLWNTNMITPIYHLVLLVNLKHKLYYIHWAVDFDNLCCQALSYFNCCIRLPSYSVNFQWPVNALSYNKFSSHDDNATHGQSLAMNVFLTQTV
jgi:hypothetical protein